MNNGAFGENFPYSNYHDLNMDWIIKIAKDFLDKYSEIDEKLEQAIENIDEETQTKIAEINEAAQQLQEDLNEWYNTHSEDLSTQLTEDLATLQSKFNELIISIPTDYTTLVNEVNSLSAELGYTKPINLLITEPVEGYYISYETGAIGTNPNWAYYPQFPVEEGKYYYASYNGAHVAFFDSNNDFISGVMVNHVPTNEDFIAPVGAKYATYSYETISRTDQFFIRSTDYKLEYVEPTEKKLNGNVEIDLLNLSTIITTGKNLFNKYNLVNGYSIDYTDASRLWRNATYCYCPDFIPVKSNTIYHHNRKVIIGIYDADFNCIQTLNHTTIADDTFTTGSEAKYIKIGTSIDIKDILQVEEGSAESSYENFGLKFIHGYENGSGGIGNFITVKPIGGDYTTISGAVENSNDGDIILVYPATYNESVKAYNKNIHIIGLERTTCILQYSARNYTNPPLEMAKGSVENMTIKAVDSGEYGDYNAYCVHCDNDNEQNHGLYFRNVDFINELHQGVGIGLRAHFTITFDSCTFNCLDQACLYCHDWETQSTEDKTGQKLIVRNCTFINNSATRATIMLQSQELATNVAEALFLGNSVANKNANGQLLSMTLWAGRTLTNQSYLGSSDWTLSEVSALNTNDTMNSIQSGTPAIPSNFTTPTPVQNRATNITGGYMEIGRWVYVNIKFTSNATATNQPSLFTFMPIPMGDIAILNMVRVNASNEPIENIPASIKNATNSNICCDNITTGETYMITGYYLKAV